ncbi:MAG: PQQ-dependent sugar dehydrogenase [Candidatus Methylomirabilales bacterium]
MHRWLPILAGLLALTPSLVFGGGAAPEFPTERGPVRAVTVASGLDHPWGLAFLPDGRMLVTERPGRVRLVQRDGSLSPPLAGVPDVVARGQGGLLDVALDPGHAENRLVYLSYAESGDRGAGTAVARGRLGQAGLEDVRVIFRQEPKVSGNNHFGSRLVFGRDGTLFVTLGERFLFDPAQDPSNHLGKIVRIQPDGGVPRDNPFAGRQGVKPEIWSLGHRNVQGAALHPETGALWIAEHGARGGDEINIVEAGRNYGWPVIGYGRHYSGQKIGEGTAKPGMEQPIHYWDPSIAPSGMAFYTADRFPEWRGSLFVGALAGKLLARLTLAGGRVAREERLLTRLGERLRDVRQGPDGLLYLLTDARDGRLLRLEPAR